MQLPYIGITDFATRDQVLQMAQLFEAARARLGVNPDRKLMVGIMMSYKTLHELPTKWSGAWPAKEDIAPIFISHPSVMNTLHYADYDGITTVDTLIQAVSYGGANLHAIQLDMVWPSPELVEEFSTHTPRRKIVLQVNGPALKAVDDDPQELVRWLSKYRRTIDYVLLDKSMGKGLGMDTEGLRPFLRMLYSSLPHLGLAVAGGLGPTSLNLVEPLVKEFPNLSWDAQGKLRPSGNSLDPIDWSLAAEYLVESLKLCS